MPIYEFHCADSELLVRSTDWSGECCPHCGSEQLMKQLSTFAAAGPAGAELPPMPSQCSGNPSACGMCN